MSLRLEPQIADLPRDDAAEHREPQIGPHRLRNRNPVIARGAFHGLETLVNDHADCLVMRRIHLSPRASCEYQAPIRASRHAHGIDAKEIACAFNWSLYQAASRTGGGTASSEGHPAAERRRQAPVAGHRMAQPCGHNSRPSPPAGSPFPCHRTGRRANMSVRFGTRGDIGLVHIGRRRLDPLQPLQRHRAVTIVAPC